MRYSKPPLSFEKQADLLLSRGLLADKPVLIKTLQNVNYYRLSGYLYPYRQADDLFKDGTTFQQVWRHYTFDRRLRFIVMDAIERVEVSVRTQLIYALVHSAGAFGYGEAQVLPKINAGAHGRLLQDLTNEVSRSKEKFVEHFKNKYGDSHEFLPLWVSGEIMSFGSVLTMYRGTSDKVKKTIAAYYNVSDQVLTSWLGTLNVVRNICAHHGRLWNRELGYKPFIPRKQKYPMWHIPVPVCMPAKIKRDTIILKLPRLENCMHTFFDDIGGGYVTCKENVISLIKKFDFPDEERNKMFSLCEQTHRVFVILTILKYLLGYIAPQTKWAERLLALLQEYPEISRWSMGFPDNWREVSFWSGPASSQV